MAEFIKTTIKKKNITIYNAGDLHVGYIGFHENAFKQLLEMVLDENAYLTLGGDQIEGKPVGHKHFNPNSLDKDKLTIEAQCAHVVKLLQPIKNRLLLMLIGNHELYFLKDKNFVLQMCKDLGRPKIAGGYQAWLQVNGVTMHHYHGIRSLPRGAKDPIQREANQKAWLKRQFEDLAGSAQAHYMYHTHANIIVPPIEKTALLNSGDNVKSVSFNDSVQYIEGKEYWTPDSRWYANCGNFRRGGGFDHIDYAEISGYPNLPISCTKTTISGNRIVNIEKVVF